MEKENLTAQEIEQASEELMKKLQEQTEVRIAKAFADRDKADEKTRAEREATEKKAAEEAATKAETERQAKMKGRVEVGPDHALEDPTLGVKNLAFFAADVKDFALTRKPSESLERSMRLMKAANTQVGSEGGFLIPPDYAADIFSRMTDTSLGLLAVADKRTVTGNRLITNAMVDYDRSDAAYRFAGMVVYDVPEGADATPSQLKFRQLEIKLDKLAVMSIVTEEMMADGGEVNLSARLSEYAGAALGERQEEDMLTGDGVNKPLGFLSSGAVATVAKEGSQTADTINWKNVLKMKSRLWKVTPSARWIATREAEIQLAQMVLAGASSDVPVYMPAGGVSGAAYSTLYGLPITYTDLLPAVGDLNDIVLIDPSQYIWVTKGGAEGGVKTSTNIYLYWLSDQQAFKWTIRRGGRSPWDRPLTPKNGSSGYTVSPFVSLAERA